MRALDINHIATVMLRKRNYFRKLHLEIGSRPRGGGAAGHDNSPNRQPFVFHLLVLSLHSQLAAPVGRLPPSGDVRWDWIEQ